MSYMNVLSKYMAGITETQERVAYARSLQILVNAYINGKVNITRLQREIADICIELALRYYLIDLATLPGELITAINKAKTLDEKLKYIDDDRAKSMAKACYDDLLREIQNYAIISRPTVLQRRIETLSQSSSAGGAEEEKIV